MYPYCGLQVCRHFQQGLLKIIVVEVMIGDVGFTPAEWSSPIEDSEFLLSGD